MSNRREFMGQFVGGVGVLAASPALSNARIPGANDRIRIGLIGAGGRGQEIFKAALRCPNVDGVAVADVYTRRLEEVKAFVPQIRAFQDSRSLLEDKSIDAVLIATPQHEHALSFVAAMQAGKDVYQEKTMAFNPDHARRMRKAFEGSGRVVQIGMQMISNPGLGKVQEIVTSGRMGVITVINAHHYRNAPYGGWMRKIPADCDTAHVDWKRFEGEAKSLPFDPQRFINWRFFWDYSGGNVFENMIHQVGYWYKALDLKIPEKVTMTGANYLSPKMEVPDTMNVTMHQEKILFNWNSMFGNDYYGEGHDLLLGNKGTLAHTESDEVIFTAQGDKRSAAPKEAGPSSGKPPDIVGYSDATDRHMQNFFDCMRSRKEPVCPFEIGFRSAVACQMAITSYRQGRTVKWDEQAQEIV